MYTKCRQIDVKNTVGILTVKLFSSLVSSLKVSSNFLTGCLVVGIAKAQEQTARRHKATSFILSEVGTRLLEVSL